jgi:hypothetical protein
VPPQCSDCGRRHLLPSDRHRPAAAPSGLGLNPLRVGTVGEGLSHFSSSPSLMLNCLCSCSLASRHRSSLSPPPLTAPHRCPSRGSGPLSSPLCVAPPSSPCRRPRIWHELLTDYFFLHEPTTVDHRLLLSSGQANDSRSLARLPCSTSTPPSSLTTNCPHRHRVPLCRRLPRHR